MIYNIRNEELSVDINTAGGSLWSIKDKEGTEYLWQGDKAYWGDRAPNLFPYIARMTDKTYTLFGKEYHMNIHGFVKYMELSLCEQEGEYLTVELKSNEETREQYPYEFRYAVTYHLNGKTLEIMYQVTNEDEKDMYFGIGGHPGFNVPLEEGLSFEDYTITFAESKVPKRVLFSPDCFVTGEEDYPLKEGKILPLTHGLFDNDAVVLGNGARELVISSEKGKKGVKVSYPKMDYVGFWHKPHTDAPYVCVEPWSSLPSRMGVVEELSEQKNLICLPKGQTYQNLWSIELL